MIYLEDIGNGPDPVDRTTPEIRSWIPFPDKNLKLYEYTQNSYVQKVFRNTKRSSNIKMYKNFIKNKMFKIGKVALLYKRCLMHSSLIRSL